MEQKLTIELTVAEINTILASLGKHPFVEIASLITNIKNQGDAQVAPQVAEQAPKEV